MITTVLQPAFMPWLGYLSMIRLSDQFVFYDDVQFLRWFINRNKIKMQGEAKWLTVPVIGHRNPINQTKICYDKKWVIDHKESLRHAYQKAPNFKEGFELVEAIYQPFETIAELAIHSTGIICNYLGFKTEFLVSSQMDVPDTGKTERLVDICCELGSKIYLTGYGSSDYIDSSKFEAKGVHMFFYKYEQKPYKQIGETFVPYLSSIDAIMNCSKEEVLAMVDMKKVLTVQSELT